MDTPRYTIVATSHESKNPQHFARFACNEPAFQLIHQMTSYRENNYDRAETFLQLTYKIESGDLTRNDYRNLRKINVDGLNPANFFSGIDEPKKDDQYPLIPALSLERRAQSIWLPYNASVKAPSLFPTLTDEQITEEINKNKKYAQEESHMQHLVRQPELEFRRNQESYKKMDILLKEELILRENKKREKARCC